MNDVVIGRFGRLRQAARAQGKGRCRGEESSRREPILVSPHDYEVQPIKSALSPLLLCSGDAPKRLGWRTRPVDLQEQGSGLGGCTRRQRGGRNGRPPGSPP